MKNSGSLFAAAVKTIAEEALRSEETHPSRLELEGYSSRKLPAEQMDCIEGHLALCTHCADVVLELMESNRQIGLTRPQRRFFSPLRLAYSTAGFFLVAFLAALLWIWLPQSPQPRSNFHVLSIPPAQAPAGGERRGLPSDDQFHTVSVPQGADSVLLLLGLAETASFDRYRLEVRRASQGDGEVVWSTEDVHQMPAGNFTVDLPAGFLPAGRYVIRLQGFRNGQSEVLAEYFVRLE